MRYGGLKQYGPGDEVKGRPKDTKKVGKDEYGKSAWETRKDERGEYKYNKTTGKVEGRKEYKGNAPSGGGSNPNLVSDLCRNMKTPGSVHYGKTAEEVVAFARLHKSAIAKLKACEQKGAVESEQAIYMEEQDCPCKDDQGNVIEGKFADKDENGNCLPETCDASTLTVPGDDCFCPDPNDPSKKIAVDCPEDGSEPDCGEGGGQGQYSGMQQQGAYWPEWRTQDKNTFMNTMMEEHGKDYPVMATTDMPEMEPVYKSWLGEAQSELASEAGRTQQVRRGAGPSSMKQAILTQMQSDPEKAIERTNLDNTNIQNQLERLTNFGVRKENMINRANAKDKYMGELATLNQNYRNENNDWRARKTMALNQGLTNAANTYNQQTEQYAIDPRTGVGIFKGGKPNKPEASTNTLDKLMKYKQMYPGFDEKTIMSAMKMDSGNSGFTPADMMYGAYGGPVYMYGGRMFDEGGFVYGDIAYPFIL